MRQVTGKPWLYHVAGDFYVVWPGRRARAGDYIAVGGALGRQIKIE